MIALYEPQGRIPIADAVIQAWRRFFNRLGIVHEYGSERDYIEAPTAIICGWIKDSIPRWRNETIRKHRDAGQDVLVVERGFVGDRAVYSGLGWNGLNNRGRYGPAGNPGDRWEQLGIPLEPWRMRRGDRVLICGQLDRDANCNGIRYRDWMLDQIRQIRQHTKRPIRFRSHPKGSERDYGALDGLPVDEVSPAKRPLEDDLDEAWAAAVWNSNCAVLATLAGVPAFVADEGSKAWPVTNHDLAEIETPRLLPREQWAHDLAYCQWTNDEIEEGMPWRHLFTESGHAKLG